MKYIMIDPGLCVEPTMQQPELKRMDMQRKYQGDIQRFREHIASLPKLPTTCAMKEGEWFEGMVQPQVMAPTELGGHWYACEEEHYRLCSNLERRRKVIVPVGQKDETGEHPELKCKKCGNHNPTWSAENDLWNSVIGEEGGILCPSCFDLAAREKGFNPYFWATKVVEHGKIEPKDGFNKTSMVS